MDSREMIVLATDKAMANRELVRQILTDADKHLMFKMMHGETLGYSEKKLKVSLEAIGCKYPETQTSPT